MRRAERSGEREIKTGLGAAEKELVRREVIYALVCEKEDDKVVGESEMVRSRRWEKETGTAALRFGS